MEPATIAAICATFVLAGFVKGVVGLGLPTVSLALLAATLGLPQAMALLLVPSFATNLWQALSGGNALAILRRDWLFFLLATVTVGVGALALTRLDPAILTGLLGVLLVVYAAINLAGVKVAIPIAHQSWLGPVFGATNGVLTGMTGSFVVPGVMYLQAVGMSRDTLVQAMGILFTLSTLALAVALGGNGLLDAQLGMMSAVALVPAIAGMMIGAKVRGRLSEARFRSALFVALLAMGVHLSTNLVA
ncbi:sulfite exporter TauE/SafE family protein [Mesorhizobium microcysteis]|uniref:Probable membrane transporter protein n=1 Tax=Neoaquamicrobium microcysteis TaxID=2682781 RepID=A0A5D4GRK1_9HYPH|nr:sulfite exporter TauE/SafE family protein [Mesorhizobium microcysteis]TYR30987.1 sulfite exporter TauE/SafE family protein [Mesorhizobium microcysteis]